MQLVFALVFQIQAGLHQRVRPLLRVGALRARREVRADRHQAARPPVAAEDNVVVEAALFR